MLDMVGYLLYDKNKKKNRFFQSQLRSNDMDKP